MQGKKRIHINGLGGSLFFGIDNDGVVKGLGDVQHVCEAISSKIRDYMDPLPEVEMIPHDIDGLHILQLNDYAGHSFTILANTFKKRTSQEWDKKYLLSFGLVTNAGLLTCGLFTPINA